MVTQFVDGDDALEFALELHVHAVPARIIGIAAWIIVVVFGIELGGVGIAFFHYFHRAGDAGNFATGVIEEGNVAFLDAIAQPIAHLVITHAVPSSGLFGLFRQVVDAKD